MNEQQFTKNFFQSTKLTPERQLELFSRISRHGSGEQPHTVKRDFLGLPSKKFKNVLPKWDRFWQIIEKRKTDRNFTGKRLDYADIEKIIASTFGKNRKKAGNFMHRTPSAGGLFGMQGYFLNLNTKGLDRGMYYIDEEKEMLFCFDKKVPQHLEKIFFYNDEKLFEKASGVFILCADLSLTLTKYGIRAIQFSFLDAGHIMQNICLAGEKSQAKVIPIGGFDEEKVSQLLRVKNEWEFPVYMGIVGR